MAKDNNTLIAELVGDLRPVTPLSFWHGMTVTAGASLLTLLLVAGTMGLRPDLLQGPFDAVFLLATGSFLVLGIAASVAVIGMSRPQVGNEHGGWVWAVAMAALLPVSALVVSLFGPARAFDAPFVEHGVECLAAGSGAGLIVGAGLTAWLRRGAPTSTATAGLLTGIAAGSIGIFAFSLHCDYNDIVHIGLWHSMAVVVSAVAGRLLVPVLVRW
jgi:hypothetical protein